MSGAELSKPVSGDAHLASFQFFIIVTKHFFLKLFVFDRLLSEKGLLHVKCAPSRGSIA